VNHGGQREIALARQFHAEKRGANDRYLVNPIIRWRGREWRLRVDLTRLIREHLNGRNREGFRMPARRERSTRYRGRRRKASDERTRGKAVNAWRLWGFGVGAAVAVDGFAKIAES
jgi:hypothetical protein